MGRIECSATIPNAEERKSVLAWARLEQLENIKENNDRVSVSYTLAQDNSDDSSKYWGIIHLFESFPIHNIHWDKPRLEVISP